MIRIRPYQDRDEEKILSWCHDRETHENWTAGMLGEFPATPEKFRFTADLMRFTAVDETGPCGFFTAREPKGTPDELRLGFVIVDPGKRGKGTGREMIRLGLRFALEIYGAERVTISVFEDNPAAYACYKAAGFRETGVKEVYCLNGRDRCAVEMECTKE